jgi:branched-chain amino acid transport system ATP-binding protein
MSTPNLLDIQGLDKFFGGLHVTRNVSLMLAAGDRVGLIGPNGAGKTTLINLITGTLEPSAGKVFFAGVEVGGLSQPQRVKLGLARTFQITQLAANLAIRRQIELAIHERLGSVHHMWRSIDSYASVRSEAQVILTTLGLGELARRTPAELAYGEQRLVEIALAIALQPKVLLLDEPMAGVPAAERQLVLDALASLPPDLAVLMIEHDMDLVFSFAKRVVVLADGAVLAEGPPEAIRRHAAVRKAYLGTEA